MPPNEHHAVAPVPKRTLVQLKGLTVFAQGKPSLPRVGGGGMLERLGIVLSPEFNWPPLRD